MDDNVNPLFMEPITPIGEGFVALHEMFKQLIAGGFTEDQALRYIVMWSIEISHNPPPPEDV